MIPLQQRLLVKTSIFLNISYFSIVQLSSTISIYVMVFRLFSNTTVNPSVTFVGVEHLVVGWKSCLMTDEYFELWIGRKLKKTEV